MLIRQFNTPMTQNLFIPLSAVGTALAVFSLGLAPAHAQAGGVEDTATGTYTLPYNSGNDDTAIGFAALLNNTSANYNTALGARALISTTTGSENTAAGGAALYLNTTGFGNSAFGVSSLFNNSAGSRNTAIGHTALVSNTTAGDNTALGYEALLNNTGSDNTATGSVALYSNTTGGPNTADGYGALFSNTTGNDNTATGYYSLLFNTTGNSNTATGSSALYSNTNGFGNTATGDSALYGNTTGGGNTATGFHTLEGNTTGSNNTAYGYQTIHNLTTGGNNTAFGFQAGLNTTGSGNVFLGFKAGVNVGNADSNIEIGTFGTSSDSHTTRIGNGSGAQTSTYIDGIYGISESNGVAVYINSAGQLGTLPSSERFKENIHDMSGDSGVLYSLRPVSFRYKHAAGPKDVPEFGLIAEEVEKINPALVVHNDDGQPDGVRYEQVNAMLLNEFLKEHGKVQAQADAISKLEAANAEQARTLAAAQQEFKTQVKDLSASLKTQAALIQKVSTRLEASAPAPVLADNHTR